MQTLGTSSKLARSSFPTPSKCSFGSFNIDVREAIRRLTNPRHYMIKPGRDVLGLVAIRAGDLKFVAQTRDGEGDDVKITHS